MDVVCIVGGPQTGGDDYFDNAGKVEMFQIEVGPFFDGRFLILILAKGYVTFFIDATSPSTNVSSLDRDLSLP